MAAGAGVEKLGQRAGSSAPPAGRLHLLPSPPCRVAPSPPAASRGPVPGAGLASARRGGSPAARRSGADGRARRCGAAAAGLGGAAERRRQQRGWEKVEEGQGLPRRREPEHGRGGGSIARIL